jgi:uracil-DNA glycosylase
MTSVNPPSVSLEEVKQTLYKRLIPSGWAEKLKTFILSSDFDELLAKLKADSDAGNKFTPSAKWIFRAFEECPYDKLNTVIVLQDPYPYLDVADGIPTSCSRDGKIQASLRYMFKEIEETVYPNEGYRWDPDLARWCNQGVLMLNCALTTTVGKVGMHYHIWQPFMAFLFDMISINNPGLVYVFMGKKAQEWAKSIPDNNYKIFTTHPAFAAHTNSDRWDSGDVFNKVNGILMRQNGIKITW